MHVRSAEDVAAAHAVAVVITIIPINIYQVSRHLDGAEHRKPSHARSYFVSMWSQTNLGSLPNFKFPAYEFYGDSIRSKDCTLDP